MSPDGLKDVVLALRYWERKQEAVTHNLANINTPGFKGERVFAQVLDGAHVSANGRTDHRPGALSTTHRTLDLALEGDGYLVVATPAGERFVRGGSMQVSPSGLLVDQHGNPVLGESGTIVLPPGEVEIGLRGEVSVEGRLLAILRIEASDPEAPLEREAGRYFVPGQAGAPVARGQVKVHQGRLEDSNVDPVGALVEMIEIQRAYSAIQKSVHVVDSVLSTVANDLGKVS
jgi:flagellar basal-body rod protein FlgF